MSRKDVVTLSYIIFVAAVVWVSFLLNSVIPVTARGFSMKMIRSDCKESPLYQGDDLTRAQRLQGLVKQSKARARQFKSKASYNESTINHERVPVEYEDYIRLYLGQVGIGTFSDQPQTSMDYYLFIDTASDLTWTQCQGASHSFDQDKPLYPYQDSSTYEHLACGDHSHCSNVFSTGTCEDGYCEYNETYFTGQATSGHLAFENLTINSVDGARESVRLIMGCGLDQRNFKLSKDDKKAHVAGILALGQGEGISFIYQLGPVSEGIFEYCLESFTNPGIENSHTYLRFGSDTKLKGAEVHKTSIIRNPASGTQYYLNLEDISVNGRSAGFIKKDFEIREDGNGGSIIDSGAQFSVLHRPHFERIKKIVMDHFEKHGILPEQDTRLLSPCFCIPEDFDAFPYLTFHFKGAAFDVTEVGGIFTIEEEPCVICLGIVSGDYGTDLILGAMQQANKRIMYDVGNLTLLFTDEEYCHLDHPEQLTT